MALQGLAVLALVAICSAARPQTRWSRQISSYTADISDWVPLSGPVDGETPQIRRQAVAEPRILSEPFPGFVKPTGFHQETFPSRAFYNSPANRQLYLQSVPSAPQNYLTEQGFGQGLRFGLSQPSFPLSQGFVGPQFSFDNVPQIKTRPQMQSTPVKFENSPPSNPPKPAPQKPLRSQPVKAKQETPMFVDGYRVENNSDYFVAKKPQSLEKIKFEYSDKPKEAFGSPRTKVEKEEVQLLYVPIESLNRGQFNFRSPLTTAQILNSEIYNQRGNPLMQNLAPELQRPAIQQMDPFNSQEFLTNFNSKLHEVAPIPKFTAVTSPLSTSLPTPTAKTKKLKPHQPPLAIFLTHDTKTDDQVKVGDVLYSLKNANSVAVLDSVNPLNAPKVFIGPSSLIPPDNYVKFELPYLSNIENIDKKLRQLPFFVAPLSYNTPQGFAKIPFPSPHVGSVVINSLMKENPSTDKPTIIDTYSNVHSKPSLYKQEQKPMTQKPVTNYYTTSSTPVNSPNYEHNYYSIEPQPISTLRPLKNIDPNLSVTQMIPHQSGSYFLRNPENRYNPSQFVNFPQETNYKNPELVTQNIFKTETITTPKTKVTTTTKSPSTYPNQLLETHNPYSINQAFHFSTPLDYQNFFDDYKEPYVNPGFNMSPSPPASTTVSSTPEPTTKLPELEKSRVTHQPQQSSPKYLESYTPEIHYETEVQNSRYPVFNTNDYFTKTDTAAQSDYTNSENQRDFDGRSQAVTNDKTSQVYTNSQTQSAIYENFTLQNKDSDTTVDYVQPTKPTSEYEQYDLNNNSQDTLSSTSSTTTSTKRSPVRTRGRPRYPTVKPDSDEYTTRATITRRPLRERKPLATRPRYETNKVTTEITTKKPFEYSESTTKHTRTRTRGRVHYKPSDSDDNYTKRNKQNTKEHDLAYQRDILHQNYPVTLMERTSTVDIEAITEPSQRIVSTNNFDSAKNDDTEDAYSNDRPLITEPIKSQFKDIAQQHTTSIHSMTDAPYTANNNDDYGYPPKGNVPQYDTVSSYDEIKDTYFIQTSPEQKTETPDILFTTKSSAEIETTIPNDEFETNRQEVRDTPEIETNTKIASQELSLEQENIVETTPSYNRVRVRPGVIRQYHQTSSTESIRTERRKSLQAVTYRPSFERRRTTMRIEEIEADLKTKQVHARTELQDYRQPIYKPEPSTESSAPSSTTETTTKRGQFRRRRPSYVTTSTEGTITRRPYDAKNRYRGRRPTEKPAEKSAVQTDTSSTTAKNNLYNRYSHRPRLSERYNKKSETEDQISEDQDSNYSFNRPKYASPDTERWSPKLSIDSFKPYNPNNIVADTKNEESEIKSKDDQLDIITARNEYEDILISVTPAYNNRVNKKTPEIPPTLEALVEQSKVTKSDSTDTMSTFETMLEEVMKSLEEQDENEYNSNVMKHKGGEIGEIPPERIISSGENYSIKLTTPLQDEAITAVPDAEKSDNLTEVSSRKSRRRGFWKKVKVRPVTEGFDVAESQYYPQVVNGLNQYVPKHFVGDMGKGGSKITTYKPNFQFLKDFFENDEETVDMIPNMDISKITASNVKNAADTDIQKHNTVSSTFKTEIGAATEKVNPGDLDLGTGSPDPTFDDSAFYTEPTEPTTNDVSNIDRSDGFSFMDYFFGVTSRNKSQKSSKNNTTKFYREVESTTEINKNKILNVDTEPTKVKLTTESSYVPEEITTETINDNNEYTETATVLHKINNEIRDLIDNTVVKVESSSMSSYMDPANVISTSMSTEVSHETEICFRGKCIKTNKNIL